MAQHDYAPWLTTLALALLGSGGFWGWWTERAKLKAARLLATETHLAALAVAVSSSPAAIGETQAAMLAGLAQFSSAILSDARAESTRLTGELNELSDRLAAVEEENRDCQKVNLRLENNLHQQRQAYDSLVNLLRRSGIDIPAAAIPGSFLMIEGEHMTAMVPQPHEPAPEQPV